MSIEDAGQQYLDLVSPLNEFLDAAPPSETWQEAAAPDAPHVALMREFGDLLVAAEWPEDIQPYVDAVVTDKDRDIAYYLARAEAKTEEEFLLAQESGEDVNAASEEFSMRLGLPSAGSGERRTAVR